MQLIKCFPTHGYIKQFWRHQICKLYQNRLVFMKVFRTNCNFFIVLPIRLKTCRSNGFFFFTKQNLRARVRNLSRPEVSSGPLNLWVLERRSTAKNYCPVSLLSVVSKIFQKPVDNALVNHLRKCGLFSDFQYGFRPTWSTADRLLYLMKLLRLLLCLVLHEMWHLLYPRLSTGCWAEFSLLGRESPPPSPIPH